MTYFKGKVGEGRVKGHKYDISTQDGKSLDQANDWGSCQDGDGAGYEHDRGEAGTKQGNGSGPEEYMSMLLQNRPRCDGR